ncbi:MAG: Na+/H+ antiporter NhaC family protein [Planctomycetota bacterium]|nr:MAG: Na+/H+ antiporter NhaC family protein [Planctomycetota bacterium]
MSPPMAPRLLFAAGFVLICLPLFLLPADPGALQGLALGRPDTGALARAFPDGPPGALELVPGEGCAAFTPDHEDALLRLAPGARLEPTADGGRRLEVVPGAEAVRLELARTGNELQLRRPGGEVVAASRTGSRAALVPPLLAILLAFLTRHVLFSLGCGILVGCFLLVPVGHPFPEAFQILFADILWQKVVLDSFKVYILGFVFLLSATVAVITRMGGIAGMVRALVRFARGSRGAQLVAYALGIGIFFDDYANTIVVGNSAGPLFDRMKVSRAKLAYIVDSTAAPVAGIAVLSTWVAFQISTFAPELPAIGLEPEQGYAIFLETIPYRFYCLFALLMVGLTILLRREIGPMVQAEAAARRGESDLLDVRAGAWTRVERAPWTFSRWENGALPLLALLGVTAWRLLALGAAAAGPEAGAAAWEQGPAAWIRLVLAETDSSRAIFDGSLAALALALALAVGRRQLGPAEALRTTAKGLGALLKDAILILVLAWSIGEICQRLDTAGYLVAVAAQLLQPALLPLVLFVTACFVAFATGSSWTTMAILQPNVVLLADRLGSGHELGSHGLLILSIGAVLEGAILGDHCSPISDTTILSSAASRVRHIDHVRTQAPYALVCAGVALLLGYAPVSLLGLPPWLAFLFGAVALVLVLRLLGRDPDRLAAAAAAQ